MGRRVHRGAIEHDGARQWSVKQRDYRIRWGRASGRGACGVLEQDGVLSKNRSIISI